MSGTSTGAPAERGSASLWLVWVCAVLTAATAAVLAVSGALVARQRAEAAADLAALAAARAGTLGGAACTAAARVASAGGARLVVCASSGQPSRPAVTVVVEVAVPRVLHALDVPPARARARAGVPP